jgi:MEMO1 family protein
MQPKMIRPAAVAGMFYPASALELRRDVSALLGRMKPQKEDRRDIRGIISPHAGYAYSGYTAAHGYAMLSGAGYETVVIVSPSHREYFEGVSVYPGDAYETPLGIVEVDGGFRDGLIAASGFVVASARGHAAEHAIEVQLPFLQEVLPPFMVLPIVMGDQRPELCIGLGEALAGILRGRNVLLVASTDLSHFHPFDVAARLDGVMISDVKEFDYEKLLQDLEACRTEACGGGPTVAVMAALAHLGVSKMEVVHYSNSGDVTGDYSSVVGYLSAIACS